MIRDWDLWPWMVNEQAGGPIQVAMYRMELGIRAMQIAIGQKLLPVLRRAADQIKKFASELERQSQRTGVKV